ncbi:predicted protein [Chaetomium globosum CBS 148.51]|uniref:Uncharacterized protein n=1 Tax=Chaetomium globosum (strain ATCC 6205 / CBS 148.51 / DSM 1962 / NBRC 6347 / NRRL 1970) TaxID=306901 RepID=Q2H597_CHAGB|nr:uncharacterized protein CHGG_06168 [Chaetomium globosum CBS 148.51]EAQ89549.1 predicted protein [Chaetomium globosum CBS 148.51]
MPTTINFVVPQSWRDSNNSENIMALRNVPPPTPVPPKVIAAYPRVFDNDEENFSDGCDDCDNKDGSDAKVASPLTYDKRPIIPSPFSARRSGAELEKPKSLLTLAVARSRSSVSATSFDSGDWVTDSSDGETDNDSGGDYMPVAQQVAEDFKRDNQAMAATRSAVKSLTYLISEIDVAADHWSAPKQPPPSPVGGIFNAISKNIATNLKLYGNLAARLQVYPRQQQQEQREQEPTGNKNQREPRTNRPSTNTSPQPNHQQPQQQHQRPQPTSPSASPPANPTPTPNPNPNPNPSPSHPPFHHHHDPPTPPPPPFNYTSPPPSAQHPPKPKTPPKNHHNTPPALFPASPSPPITIPLRPAQREKVRHRTEYNLPLNISMVQDRRQLAAGGPLGLGSRGGSGRGKVMMGECDFEEGWDVGVGRGWGLLRGGGGG